MPQYARPDANGSYTAWTASAGADWECVDEVVADDADFISASTGLHSSPDQSFRLSDVNDPGVSSGHVIRIRAKDSDGTTSITFKLWQQETPLGFLVATASTGTLTTSFQEYSYTLSASEANSITDYQDLWIEIDRSSTGGKTQYISQVFLEVPGATPAQASVRIEIQALKPQPVRLKQQAVNVSQLVVSAPAIYASTPIRHSCWGYSWGYKWGNSWGPPTFGAVAVQIVVQALQPQPTRIKTTNILLGTLVVQALQPQPTRIKTTNILLGTLVIHGVVFGINANALPIGFGQIRIQAIVTAQKASTARRIFLIT